MYWVRGTDGIDKTREHGKCLHVWRHLQACALRTSGISRVWSEPDVLQQKVGRMEAPFDRRRNDPLRSPTTGAVDLGCQRPSPALLLSAANRFQGTSWAYFGGEDRWRRSFLQCPRRVVIAAKHEAENILRNGATDRIEKVQKLAESPALRNLMDSLCGETADPAVARELQRFVAADRPLAEALEVRRMGTPSGRCHEVVVSSLDHEVKSVTGYPASNVYCYTRVPPKPHNFVAVGGVCIELIGQLGSGFEPKVPGKLVIYEAEWMTPWAALLCFIGATNTILMIVFLVTAPWTQGFEAESMAFVFLAINVVMEVVAIALGWRLLHRWEMGWRKHLVRSDPFHAMLTADHTDCQKVMWILGLEAVGGVASVVGLAFTSGVPLELLSTVAIPVATALLTKSFSTSSGFKSSLIVGAMSFYLLEFVYEIVVISILNDSILGWVVIASCIVESLSLIWIIATVLFAIHFVSVKQKDGSFVGSSKTPARIRDGTLTALSLSELPQKGLMGTSALGSARLPGNLIPDGGSVIKQGSASCLGLTSTDDAPDFVSGWLSLTACADAYPFTSSRLTGEHNWLCDVVVACGMAIPILAGPRSTCATSV